jgi:hypothetical protein
MQSGRGWAYLTLILGSIVSVTGNVLDMRRITNTPDWFDYTAAGMWPVWLFLAIEVHARVPWQPKWTHRIVRHGGLTLAAALSAVVSYGHLHELLLARNQGWLTAMFGPVVIDCIMAMSTMALVLTRTVEIAATFDDWRAELARKVSDLPDASMSASGIFDSSSSMILADNAPDIAMSGHPQAEWLAGLSARVAAGDDLPDSVSDSAPVSESSGHDLLDNGPDMILRTADNMKFPRFVRTARTADKGWKATALRLLMANPDQTATWLATQVFSQDPPSDSNRKRVARLLADLSALSAEQFTAKHGVDPTGEDS